MDTNTAVDGDDIRGVDIDRPEWLEPETSSSDSAEPDLDFHKRASTIASATLANGNVIRYVEFSSGVLVVEEGPAYTSPATNHIPVEMRRIDQLIATWEILVPDQPVPHTLVDAQRRKVEHSRQPRGVEQPTVTVEDFGGPSMNQRALIGCGNGCCDPNWLVNHFSECGTDFFFFNYGYSWTSTNDDAWSVSAMACAAVGMSFFQVVVDQDWDQWWLPEGWYQRYYWVAGYTPWFGWDKKPISTYVNDPFHPHTHTQCVGYWH